MNESAATVHIRHGGAVDRAFLEAMVLETFKTNPRWASRGEVWLRESAKSFCADWGRPDDLYFIAESPHPTDPTYRDRVGALWLRKWADDMNAFGLSLGVVDNQRNAGLGSKLLDYALEYCRHHLSISALLVDAAPDSRCLTFFHRHGFQDYQSREIPDVGKMLRMEYIIKRD